LQLYEFWLKASNRRQERYDIVERELDNEREAPNSGLHR
jgi:hypothetical protein